jgi:hypothetical protein
VRARLRPAADVDHGHRNVLRRSATGFHAGGVIPPSGPSNGVQSSTRFATAKALHRDSPAPGVLTRYLRRLRVRLRPRSGITGASAVSKVMVPDHRLCGLLRPTGVNGPVILGG